VVKPMGIERLCTGILALGLAASAGGWAQQPPAQPPVEPSPQASTQQPAQPSAQPAAPYQPQFPGDPARSDSEAKALGYMRVVLRAEREYKKRHDKFTPSLEELGGTASFTKRMAHTPDRGDYLATYRPHKEGFIFTMTPKQMDSEHRSFYAEEDMVIHADDQKPADLSSPKIK
jgi:hypothetical protein